MQRSRQTYEEMDERARRARYGNDATAALHGGFHGIRHDSGSSPDIREAHVDELMKRVQVEERIRQQRLFELKAWAGLLTGVLSAVVLMIMMLMIDPADQWLVFWSAIGGGLGFGGMILFFHTIHSRQ